MGNTQEVPDGIDPMKAALKKAGAHLNGLKEEVEKTREEGGRAHEKAEQALKEQKERYDEQIDRGLEMGTREWLDPYERLEKKARMELFFKEAQKEFPATWQPIL